jgi:hypothetical protein
METIFDFTVTTSEYVHSINSSLTLHIQKVNHTYAILYFTDETNNKITIPGGVVVYTLDYQSKQKSAIVAPTNSKSFFLSWMSDYTVELNSSLIINILNQRKWSILTS